jgi:hypothetical protein
MNAGVDARLTLARPDLAAAALEGVLPAERYARARTLQLATPSAPLLASPDPASERLDELIYGERFEALDGRDGFLWGQALRDGYVGYVEASALALVGPPPTHRVSALSTYALAAPSIKSRASGPFSFNALVAVEAEEGPFARSRGGAFFWAADLAPIGTQFETDPAAVAERFLGTPYLWSGRTSLGIDCSGLIQQALYACGRACPRDADQQAQLGRPVQRAELARGDLVCWSGHIGMMLDQRRLLHATAHRMATVIEPLADVVARGEAGGRGSPNAFRRL